VKSQCVFELVPWTTLGKEGRRHAALYVRPAPVADRPEGTPDLNGIWQANNSANWNIEAHPAKQGPVFALGAAFSVPPGTGVVEGDEIPYLPEALAKRDANGVYKVWVKGGREETPLEAVAWAQECVARGAGEILLTSIDRDGARTGYDLAITRAVADAVHVPVIAIGGITHDNAGDVIAAGADGVAVIGAILNADDPQAAAERLRRQLDSAYGVPSR